MQDQVDFRSETEAFKTEIETFTVCVFQGYRDDDQSNSCTYSLNNNLRKHHKVFGIVINIFIAVFNNHIRQLYCKLQT